MNGLTPAQKQCMQQMKGYRLVARLHTGALIVVYGQKYHEARIIDLDGNVWSLSHYLAVIDHGTSPMGNRRLE